jgi:hypothetical protein
MLGWKIVELKGRIQIALIELEDSGLHLASVWRACFNRIAALQDKAFPRGTTAQTLYEPPSKENLPYLYPPEPDYANVGISGATILDNFQLYEVTRRAINCLTLLYVKEDESLIPDAVKRNQNHLVAEILKATQNPGGGGGMQPTGEPSSPQDNLQKAKETLAERTVKFLDAWDGYLRENYYTGGLIPNNDLELIAYEAGRSMASLSWGISAALVPLERNAKTTESQANTQTASGQLPDTSPAFVKAWQTVFRNQAVIHLQHEISALSSALDTAYYLKRPDQKRPDDDAVLVAPNPELPSQVIQAVKNSIDYWQRAVDWIAVNWKPDNPGQLGDPKAPVPAPWSRPMRLALTEQANIWQTLMTGQQSLRAYSMESVTHKIMQDVTDEIQKSVRTDFSASVQQAEQVMKEVAQEVKAAIDVAGQTAVQGLEKLFQSCVRAFWPIFGVIVVICIGSLVLALAVPAIKDGATAASGGAGLTAVISAILGYFGLGNLKGVKAAQQTAIQNGRDTAKTTVDSQTTAGATGVAGAKAGDGNLLTRIEGAAQETGAMMLKAFERGFEQIRIELDGLNRSVAVAYPLIEFFGLTFRWQSEAVFLTNIIWSGMERGGEIKRVMRAAFGPLTLFISSSAGGSKSDDRSLKTL